MSTSLRLGLASLACAAFVAGGATTARADGAFPDSSQVLLPTDKPNEIIVGTNFGLLISADAGKTWQWVCEQEIATCATLYQIAPAPSDAIFAVSTTGLVSLGADACGYSGANGLTGQNVSDAFIDPSNASRMFAIHTTSNDGGMTEYVLVGSSDGGMSFGDPLFTTDSNSSLSGVEIAKSDPMTVYVTEVLEPNVSTTILHASDGGTQFAAYPQDASLGRLSIAAVDATNPQKVYFRSVATSGESLVISSDGGATTHVAQALPAGYVMSAFYQEADGTLDLAGLTLNQAGSKSCAFDAQAPYSGTTPGVAYRSTDGGATWTTWAGAPHLRGLGQRAGTLYAIADNFADGFAVGQSTDGGKTWTKLLQYVGIQGPLTCETVASTCGVPWEALEVTFGIMPGSTTTPTKKHGCSFSAASGHARELLFLLPLLVGLALYRRRQQLRRP
jgi:MYXO-CTERM domain-containing protein